MNPQVEVKPNQKPASDIAEQHKISGIVLRESCRFNHSDNVNTTAIGSAAITIQPAKLLPSGDWRPTNGDEQAHGFGLSQIRGAGTDRKCVRAFIPMHNVREVVYQE